MFYLPEGSLAQPTGCSDSLHSTPVRPRGPLPGPVSEAVPPLIGMWAGTAGTGRRPLTLSCLSLVFLSVEATVASFWAQTPIAATLFVTSQVQVPSPPNMLTDVLRGLAGSADSVIMFTVHSSGPGGADAMDERHGPCTLSD